MALTMKWFTHGADNFMNGAVDWDTDTIKVTLHTSTYSPSQANDDFFNDATNELSTANGYTAGGVTLGSATRSAATTVETLDGADSSWSFSGNVTFRYAVVRKARGGASSADELIGWGDFGSDQTLSGSFTIQWNASGIFTITVT